LSAGVTTGVQFFGCANERGGIFPSRRQVRGQSRVHHIFGGRSRPGQETEGAARFDHEKEQPFGTEPAVADIAGVDTWCLVADRHSLDRFGEHHQFDRLDWIFRKRNRRRSSDRRGRGGHAQRSAAAADQPAEEERMEAALPGLREMAEYLAWIRPELIGADHTYHVLMDTGGTDGESIEDRTRSVIKNADERSIQQLVRLLESIAGNAYEVLLSEKRLKDEEKRIDVDKLRVEEVKAFSKGMLKNLRTGLNLRELSFKQSLFNLEEFEKSILSKIAMFEERLPRFRREIENYFDQ
jgi:hypothetical protein